MLLHVRYAHIINNRSTATIKASFIVSFVRLFTIVYYITNLAAIKYFQMFIALTANIQCIQPVGWLHRTYAKRRFLVFDFDNLLSRAN